VAPRRIASSASSTRSPYKACSSPKTYEHLKLGKHTFKVRAKDSVGAIDPTPVKKIFEIKLG